MKLLTPSPIPVLFNFIFIHAYFTKRNKCQQTKNLPVFYFFNYIDNDCIGITLQEVLDYATHPVTRYDKKKRDFVSSLPVKLHFISSQATNTTSTNSSSSVILEQMATATGGSYSTSSNISEIDLSPPAILFPLLNVELLALNITSNVTFMSVVTQNIGDGVGESVAVTLQWSDSRVAPDCDSLGLDVTNNLVLVSCSMNSIELTIFEILPSESVVINFPFNLPPCTSLDSELSATATVLHRNQYLVISNSSTVSIQQLESTFCAVPGKLYNVSACTLINP